MKIQGEARMVRVYIGESDQWHGEPLYNAIVQSARKHGLAGATVLRGIEGFGAHSRIHTANILRLSEDLPIVVEIIDLKERLDTFMTELDAMVTEGLVTVQDCEVIKYTSG